MLIETAAEFKAIGLATFNYTDVDPVTGGGRGRGEPGFYYALEGGVPAYGPMTAAIR